MTAGLAGRLKAAAAVGDPAALEGSYSADARIDAGLPGRRIRRAGAEAVLEALGECWTGGAGGLVEWDCREHAAGLAVWLERRAGDGTAQRQRHYLHVRDGLVTRHWVYAAPPRSTAPEVEPDRLPGRDVFAALGPVAEHAPLVSRGWSGNRLERATMDDGRRLIAKRVDPKADWIGRATADPGREGLLVAEGHLGRLPPEIDPAVISATPDGDAWWIVMRDATDDLFDDASPIPRADHRRIMAALNGMWTAFWGERIGCLTSLRDRLAILGPPTAERERAGHDLLPNQCEAAWDAFREAVEPDVGDAVIELATEPEPLAAALERRGTTLIHADVRDEQTGLTADGRFVLLDWGVATQGHPAADLAWYLMHCGWRIEATRDQMAEDFRAARGDADDPVALDLGLLSGLVQYGWIVGHSAVVHPDPAERAWAREELEWWVPKARRGLEQLS